MVDQSQPLGAGIGWIEPMPFSDITGITGERELIDLSIGAAGAGLGLLYADRQHLGEGALDAAIQTGDDRWLDWMHANMRGLLATGAPETRGDGLWQNFSQCCGDAGIGDYALSLGHATGRAEYRDLAERIETVILAGSVIDDAKRSWPQAEHRNRPDFVESQTGYMQGAAGIASFLLHLATIDGGTNSKIPLPDSPFTH